jgi:hypothetical protein
MNIAIYQNQAVEIVKTLSKRKKILRIVIFIHTNIFLWLASSEKSVESYKTGKY